MAILNKIEIWMEMENVIKIVRAIIEIREINL